MNLNKKSLIQIIVLVVLLVGGGGVFLATQEGGLDFLSDLIPGMKEEPKPAPAPAPVAKPKPDVPPIPMLPAKGKVGGKPFTVERATIENGVLTLFHGGEGNAVEVAVDLRTKRWDVPAGRNFKVLKQTKGDLPRVALRVTDAGQLQTPQVYGENYTMVLELGAEKDKKLPGKIHLALPDEQGSQVAGTFDAEVRGFRIINGKPDLSADSVETLQYLVFRELLKDDPEKILNNVAFYDAQIDAGSTKNATGYLEVDYRVGEAAPTMQRFQFVKDQDQWRVRGTLRGNQVDEAHPLAAPGAKDAPAVLIYLAAKRLEGQVAKKKPEHGIYGATFTARHSDKTKVGVTEVSYRPSRDGEPVQLAYLFRFKGSGWALERELDKKEKVNVDTGKIERAKK
jgi:hypothetical protein